MDVQAVLDKGTKETLAVEELRALAGDAAAFGDDIVSLFAAQAERRAVAAGDVLKAAETESRDLLASENRQYEKHMREAEHVRSLQRDVEARTAQRNYVPRAALETRSETAVLPTVLTTEQKFSTWLESRGGYHYQGEQQASSLSLGRLVRGMIGQRQTLSALESRVLAEGTDSLGGFTVPEIVATRFIDRVRAAVVVLRAGAAVIPMTSDTLHIARLASGLFAPGSPAVPALEWKVENAPINEADLTLERVTFTARTLPVIVRMSVELSEDSNNIDSVIETEMARSFALELDRAALVGSGTAPEPRGVINQSGVNIEDFNGVTPTNYDFIVDAIGRLWALNIEPNARIYNSALATTLAKLKEGGGSNQPLRAPDVVSALREFRTNQLVGLGSPGDDATMFVGDFTQLMIGMRTSFRLEASRVAGDAFENLQILVRGYLRADVQLAHPEAFDVTTDIGTS